MTKEKQTFCFYFLLPKVRHISTGMAYAGKAEKHIRSHVQKLFLKQVQSKT